MINLVIIYKREKEVTENKHKAVEFYKKAMKIGSSQAMNDLAICYEKGQYSTKCSESD
jgi:TPR repeat protein